MYLMVAKKLTSSQRSLPKVKKDNLSESPLSQSNLAPVKFGIVP